jgi:hypothetical protein
MDFKFNETFAKIKTLFIHGSTEENFGKKIIVGATSYEEVHSTLVDYQNSSNQRKDMKWAFTTLQLHLAMDIIATKNTLKQIKDKNPNMDLTSPVGYVYRGTQDHLNSLFKIADGIAFRFLDFNYQLMRVLAFNNVSTVDFKDAGHQHEAEVFCAMSDSTNYDVRCLWCGVNKILNVGDVILKSENHFEIVEIKSGKSVRGARIQRQKARMKELKDFFEEGESKFGDLTLKLKYFKPRYHFLDKLQAGFDIAKDLGPQLLEIAEYHLVYCLFIPSANFNKLVEVQSEIIKIAEERFHGEQYIVVSSHESRFGNATLIPVTVYPLKPELICHLLLGGAIYFSIFSWSGLKRHLEKLGWIVKDLTTKPINELEKQGLPVLFLSKQINGGKIDVSIPLDFIASMLFELMSFESYLDSYENPEQSFPQGPNHWVPVFENDERLWR